MFALPIGASEQVEIVVVLDEAGRYAVDELLHQLNRELRTDYSIDAHRGERRLLSATERLMFAVVSEAGLLDAQIESDCITLRLPRPDSPETRRQSRQQIRKWFGISDQRWMRNQGLHAPESLDVARPLLLVIHGLEAGPTDFARFREACRETGVQLLAFDYPNDGPLADAGDCLSDELKKLARRHPGLRLAVVGHSMGGLIARYVVETPGKDPGCITDLFMVGTPHNGSRLAGQYAFAEILFQVAPAGLKGLRSAMTDGLGEAADDMSPRSPFLEALNARPKPAAVRYHVGIGTRSFLDAKQQAALVADLQRMLAARAVEPRAAREWIALLSCDELTDGRGDGAVSVASADLKQADNQRTFALNHAELLSLPGRRPEFSEVFRWIASEMKWPPMIGERSQ